VKLGWARTYGCTPGLCIVLIDTESYAATRQRQAWSSLPETEPPSFLPEEGEPFLLPDLLGWRLTARGIARVLGLALVILAALSLVSALSGSVSMPTMHRRCLAQELYQRHNPFKSTKIYDRKGRILFEIFDPLGGRRTVAPYAKIPRVLIDATVARKMTHSFPTRALARWRSPRRCTAICAPGISSMALAASPSSSSRTSS